MWYTQMFSYSLGANVLNKIQYSERKREKSSGLTLKNFILLYKEEKVDTVTGEWWWETTAAYVADKSLITRICKELS